MPIWASLMLAVPEEANFPEGTSLEGTSLEGCPAAERLPARKRRAAQLTLQARVAWEEAAAVLCDARATVRGAARVRAGAPWSDRLRVAEPAEANGPRPHESDGGPPQDPGPPHESFLHACGSSRWLDDHRLWLLLELLPARGLPEAPRGLVA